MDKVFDINASQGSYKDSISGTIPVNTGVFVKHTLGRTYWFPSGAALDTFGVVTGVQTIAIIIKPSGNGDILLDNGAAKLSISGGNVSGTGLTQAYVNNVDTDVIAFNTWSLVIAEFSGGINFNTDFEVDPTMTLFLAMVEANDILISLLQREALWQQFLNLQNIETSLTNFGGLRPVGNFDGVDDYVLVPNNTSLDTGVNDFAIGGRIKKVSNGNFSYFIAKGLNSSSTNGYGIAIDVNGKIYGVIGANNTRIISPGQGVALDDETWHDIVANFDRSANIEFFVDSFSVGTFNISSLDGYSTIVVNDLFLSSFGALSAGFLFQNLADVFLLKRLMTSEEISDYSNGSVPLDATSLWRLDEGSGVTIGDSIGSNNGTLTNATTGSFWQQTKQLRADLVLFEDDGTNWNTDNITKTLHIANYQIGSGSFRCKEDDTGKYLECVTNGTLIFDEGINLSDIVGNGYIKKLTGDLSEDEGGTVAAATNVAWSGNKITITMISGQKLYDIAITRGAN